MPAQAGALAHDERVLGADLAGIGADQLVAAGRRTTTSSQSTLRRGRGGGWVPGGRCRSLTRPHRNASGRPTTIARPEERAELRHLR